MYLLSCETRLCIFLMFSFFSAKKMRVQSDFCGTALGLKVNCQTSDDYLSLLFSQFIRLVVLKMYNNK